MDHGLWVWPSDPREQQLTLRRISESEHLMAALKAIPKSKEGLSNAELDEILSDNSSWMTLWVIRQLTSLGLVKYNVSFFGNPARYTLSDLGRDVYQKLTGQPAPAQPVVQPAAAAPAAQPAQPAPRPPAPGPAPTPQPQAKATAQG
jgi:hypothetical protein